MECIVCFCCFLFKMSRTDWSVENGQPSPYRPSTPVCCHIAVDLVSRLPLRIDMIHTTFTYISTVSEKRNCKTTKWINKKKRSSFSWGTRVAAVNLHDVTVNGISIKFIFVCIRICASSMCSSLERRNSWNCTKLTTWHNHTLQQ